MNEAPTSRDWSADRGARWLLHVTRLEAMLGAVDPALFSALDASVSVRVADVGCGGGGTSVALAGSLPPRSVVHGFDISPDLVGYAQARRDALGLSVGFTLADVGEAAPSQTFDRIVSRFGTMFFHEPLSAFSNLRGWLAPEGRLALAVWGEPSANPWMTEIRDAIGRVVELPVREHDTPGPFRYADVELLLGVLRSAGFRAPTSAPWLGRVDLGGGLPAEEAADFAIRSFSVGAHLDDLPPRVANAVRDDLVDRLRPYEVERRVRMPAAAHIVTAGA